MYFRWFLYEAFLSSTSTIFTVAALLKVGCVGLLVSTVRDECTGPLKMT